MLLITMTILSNVSVRLFTDDAVGMFLWKKKESPSGHNAATSTGQALWLQIYCL